MKPHTTKSQQTPGPGARSFHLQSRPPTPTPGARRSPASHSPGDSQGQSPSRAQLKGQPGSSAPRARHQGHSECKQPLPGEVTEKVELPEQCLGHPKEEKC